MSTLNDNTAIIGFTGFVGGNLAGQFEFSNKYNSRNIRNAAGREFELVVCAAAPGSMFEANRYPERDNQRITNLIGNLASIRTKRFILISSIAVLKNMDCGHDERATTFQTELAYGRNRRILEEFCSSNFERCLIVRLPALFGSGLKKNFLFDIMNPLPSMLTMAAFQELRQALPPDLGDGLTKIYSLDLELDLMRIDRRVLDQSGQRNDYDAAVTELGLSAVRFTHPESRFQFYDLSELWTDISLGADKNLNVLHLAPEPLSAGNVYRHLTGSTLSSTGAKLHCEDIHTRHADLWGMTGIYSMDAKEVLARLQLFFNPNKAQE